MRLRQVALVAKDIQPVARQLQEVFGFGEPYPDPGIIEFGLENLVFPVGDTFLEIVSPKKEGTTAERLLDKRGGDGGYMVIFQTDRRLDAERERMAKHNVRIVWSENHGDAATIHLHPKDIGGAIVSIDEMKPPESWKWAGPDWEKNSRREPIAEIVGAEIQSSSPETTAKRWGEILGFDASQHNGVWQVAVDSGHVRFVESKDGRGDGVSGIAFRATNKAKILAAAKEKGLSVDGDSVTIAGVQICLV